MTTPTLKMVALTIGIGGAAIGSGIAVKNYLSTSNEIKQKENAPKAEAAKPKSIVELLKAESLKLIKENDSKEELWTPKWNAFKKAHDKEEPKEMWTIDKWATNKDNDTGLNAFKKLCETNGAKEVQNKQDELYTKVKTYCTKAITTQTKHE